MYATLFNVCHECVCYNMYHECGYATSLCCAMCYVLCAMNVCTTKSACAMSNTPLVIVLVLCLIRLLLLCWCATPAAQHVRAANVLCHELMALNCVQNGGAMKRVCTLYVYRTMKRVCLCMKRVCTL
jgi:hypothetical protein